MSAHDDRTDAPNGSRPPARRGLAAALASFMEERNILWGELVGGLLVVGCSVALVVSLWHTLRENPIFQFCTFTGAVAAVFGAGLYTLRRWKLHSTSRGLLLMALLLTPLTILALTSEGGGGGRGLITQILALLILGALAWRAGRVLTPEGPGLLAAAVGLTSAWQVLAARLIRAGQPDAKFLVLTLLPAACFVLTAIAFLWQLARSGSLDSQRAGSLFVFLGVGTFSLVATLGLVTFLRGDLDSALGLLALPTAVAGLAPLAGGAFIHRGLTETEIRIGINSEIRKEDQSASLLSDFGVSDSDFRPLASARTGGTTVALAGMVVMLLAVGLAWPRPQAVLAVCALDFLAFTVVAFRFRLPVAHAVALPCLTGACLMASFLTRGLLRVPDDQLAGRMLELMIAPATAAVILFLFAAFGMVSELLARWNAGEHALFYALGSAAVGLLSLALVTPYGPAAPGQALAVYGLTGLGALLLNLRWRREEANYLGLVLLAGASMWGLWAAYGRVVAPWGAVLALEALVLGVLATRQRGWIGAPLLRRVSSLLALAAAAVAGWTAWESLVATASPWALAHVITAASLSALATLRAISEGNRLLARLGAWLVLVTFVVAAGWMAELVRVNEPLVLLAGSAALASILLALAVVSGQWPVASEENKGTSSRLSLSSLATGHWPLATVQTAWAETAIGAGLVALALILLAPEARAQSAILTCVSIAAFLLAWAERKTSFTWAGSALVLAAILHLLLWGIAPRQVAHPILVALLAHATLVLAVSLWLKTRMQEVGRLRLLLIEPLGASALVSSLLAIPAVLEGVGGQLGALSLWTLWLAALWLVIAWLNRWPGLFAAFQAALTLAVLFAVAAWLQGHTPDLSLPRALQVYGAGLAVLSLFWVAVRIGLRSNGESVPLLSPRWPAVDRVVLAGLVLGQLAVAVLGILPGLVEELIPAGTSFPFDLPGRDWTLAATGLPALALLLVLAAALAVEIRVRVRGPVLLGLLILALTVPVLAAGRFAEQRAVASALRWGAGICLLACSLPIWLRHRLEPWAEWAGLSGDAGPHTTARARRLLVIATVIPVLALTLIPMGIAYAGGKSPGVAPGSVFLHMGRLTPGVAPLFMVCVGLIVHALRERLPGYAFVVGLGGNLMVSLIVRLLHRREPLADWYVLLIQANAVAFAAMALLWLAARRRLYGENGTGALLVLQVGLGVAASLLMLASGLLPLLADPADVLPAVAQAGGAWAWLALIATAVATTWYAAALGRHLLVHVGAATALAVGVLLACATAHWSGQSWLAYHVLTAAWLLAGAAVLAVGWRASRPGTGRFADSLGRDGWEAWTAAIGLLVFALGLRSVPADPSAPWWPAATILLAGGLAAGLALWKRKEGWAFTAGVGVLLAVALVVGHRTWGQTLGEWWVVQAQAAICATAVVALIWLAVVRRLYSGSPSAPAAPLLAVQMALPLAGTAVLLLDPLCLLILHPEAPPTLVAQAGHVGGWLALLLAAAAALTYAGRMLTGAALHVLGGLGLAVGVLMACTAARWNGAPWLAYHTLTVAWAVLGAVILAAARLVQNKHGVAAWVATVAALVVALALREVTTDSLTLWWPVGAVLAASGLLAGLAIRERREAWALVAGLGVNLAACLLSWHAHQGFSLSDWWVTLVRANAVAAAATTFAWVAGCRLIYGTRRPDAGTAPLLSLQLAMLLLGNAVLLAVPACLLVLDPGSVPPQAVEAGTVWGWLTLAVAVAAVVWHFGRTMASVGVHALGGLGLAVVVLAACTAANGDRGNWLSYHVLTAGCVLLGAAALTAGRRSAGSIVQGWVVVCGVLTLALALRGLTGDPAGPWWPAGMVVATAALAVGLAVWQRREGWAFAAGLCLNLAVSIVLWQRFPGLGWVPFVQANAIACAAVALGWLVAGRRLYGSHWPRLVRTPLLSVQVALGLAGNLLLLLHPAVLLIRSPGALPETVAQAGSSAGWLALLAALVPAAWYAGPRLLHRAVPILTGLAVALGILVACTAATWDRGDWLAYHVLMVAWGAAGASALFLARASLRARPVGQAFALVASVASVGALVLGLALRAVHQDPASPWWPAGALLFVGGLAAGLALWRQREAWAFIAGIAVLLAVSLVVEHSYRGQALEQWWTVLVQANAIAAAAVTLGWLTASRRLYATGRPALDAAPLLGVQVALLLLANAALLLGPLFLIVRDPADIARQVVQAGHLGGWLALLLAVGVATWYAGQVLAPAADHLLRGLGLAVGVLAACTAAQWDRGQWLTYHTLTAAWGLLGIAILARPRNRDGAMQTPAWVGAVCVLVVALALRGVLVDPYAPWWPAGAVLLAGTLAAAVGLRQRDDKWIFAAGIGVILAVALVVEHGHRGQLLERWWVTLAQAGAIAAAAVALGWLALTRLLYGEARPEPRVAPLLALQTALPLLGNAVLLLGPLALLLRRPELPAEQVIQAGGPLGWLALLLAAGVAAWYASRALAPAGVHILCSLGLAAGVLAACTAARWDAGAWLAYHTLTVAWAAFGGVVLAASVVVRARLREEERADLVPFWVAAAGALVVALGLRGVTADPGAPWWPAGAVLATSGLSAALALRQRREAWAFTAGLGVLLAVSLVTWHGHKGLLLAEWWTTLVRANVIAAALVACAWLAAARRIYGTTHPGLVRAPLLTIQVFLGLAGNAVLLIEPAVQLILRPGTPHAHVLEAGAPAAWLALLAAGAAAAWRLRIWARRTNPLGVLAAGLAAGLLMACTVASRDRGDWLTYHTLVGCWSAVGFLVLLLSWLGRRPDDRADPDSAAGEWLQRRITIAVSVAGLLVLGLLGRGLPEHPSSSWWAAGAVLALSVQAGLLAVWQRRETWAFIATQGMELAVSLLMLEPNRLADFGEWWVRLLQVNILASCVGMVIWLAAGRRLYRDRPAGVAGAPLLTVQLLISLLGVAALLVNPALVSLLVSPGALPESVAKADGIWGWLTLLAATAVTVGHIRLTRMGGGVHVLGSQGLAAGVMAACTAAAWDRGQWLSYHVLMASWLLVGSVMLAGSWWGARRGQEASAGKVPRVWVPVVGLPVLALALRAVLVDPTGPWWPAGAVLCVSVLAVLQGLWQRSERWVFAAGLGVNLAASLVLWRFNGGAPLREWWFPLLQANVIACALVALAWLAAGPSVVNSLRELSRRLDSRSESTTLPIDSRSESTTLRTLQVGLAVLGNLVLLADPAVRLILRPSPLDPLVALAGTPVAWLALLLTVVAAGWYGGRWLAGAGVSLVCGATLSLAVLAACTAARWDGDGWLAYHVLTIGWALAGLIAFVVARVSASQAEHEAVPEVPFVLRVWVPVIGVLVSGLALRGALADTGSAWWSAGPLLSVSVMTGLLAAWQRREGGVFAAALGFNAAVSLVLWRGHRLEPLQTWWVQLVQANIVASSVAALGWLAAGRWFYDEQTLQKGRAPLRGAQSLVGLGGNALLLTGPAVLLVVRPGALLPGVSQAGGVQGWCTLLLAALPAAWHFGRRLAPAVAHLLGAMGLAVGVLAACTAAPADSGQWLSFHVLTAGWAIVGMTILGAGRVLARGSAETLDRPTSSASTFQSWSVVLGALVLGLALRGLVDDPIRPWWSAGSILSVSVLAAGLALWQKREGWAFLGGLGVNLALSLVLVSMRTGVPAGWVLLLQANVIAVAVVALAWLAAAQGIYGQAGRAPGEARLLTAQIALGLAGNVLLLAPPLLLLVSQPEPLAPAVRLAGGVGGWLALGAALAAAAWHAGRMPARWGTSLLCALSLGVGVLLACSASRFGTDQGGWPAYHVLTVAWALTGFVTLALGWRVDREQPALAGAAGWVAGIAGLVLLLGLRGMVDDPGRPWWSAGAVLGTGGLAAGLALWQRREAWAFAAGVCVNGAASLVTWHLFRSVPVADWWVVLVQVNIAASSACALVWLAAWKRLYASQAEGPTPLLNLQVFLGLAGNVILLAGPALMLVLHPGELSPAVRQAGTLRGWVILLLAILPAAWHAWRSLAQEAVHVICGLAVGAIVLAACTAGAAVGNGWLGYRVLTAGLALAGLTALAGGWLLQRRSLSFPTEAVQGWAIGLGTLALGLVLRGVTLDPIGPRWSAAVALPVSLTAAGLAGWRRREGWAFVAGLGVNLAASFLTWDHYRGAALEDWWPRLLQINLATAGAVGLAWLALTRSRAVSERANTPLLDAQLTLPLVGNAVLLAAAGIPLVLGPGDPDSLAGQAGHLWGWLSLALALVGAAAQFGRSSAVARIHVAGCLALLGGVLIACTVAARWPDGWVAYHALMVVWALAGPALVLVECSQLAPRVDLRCGQLAPRVEGEDQLAERVDYTKNALTTLWTAALGTLTLLLALRGAGVDPGGPWWSAGGILAAGASAAILALWLRREGWAFIAGLCGNLAVSLLLVLGDRVWPLEKGWVLLVQANAIVAGVAALAWLAAARRLYGRARPGFDTTPLLNAQVGLGLAGNALLLAVPLLWLVLQPGELHHGVRQAGGLLGWAALLLGLGAASWHAGRTLARGGISAACGLALALGVLIACTAAPWDNGRWQAYHVLLAAWSLVGLTTVVAGWLATHRALTLRADAQGEEGVRAAATLIQTWGIGIGLAVVMLALRAVYEDPTGPWWSVAALLCASSLAGMLAVWARRQQLVYASGLLLNGTAVLAAMALGVHAPATLLHVSLLCLAVTAAAWSVLEMALKAQRIDLRTSGSLPFAHAGTLLPLVVLFVLAGAGAISTWVGQAIPLRSPLAWGTLAAVVAALAACLWDATARFTLAGMYAAGLSALALWLGATPAGLRWAAPVLGLFVTGTTAWWRAVGHFRLQIADRRLKDDSDSAADANLQSAICNLQSQRWFPPAQTLLAALVVLLSLWLCLTEDSLAARFRGPLSLALLLPAAFLFAGALPSSGAGSPFAARALAQYGALLLGALVLVESTWAWPPPAIGVALQYTGLLMAACSLLTLLYGVGLDRLPEESGWPIRGQHASALLGILSLALVAAVLSQEAILAQQGVRPMMALPVMVAVAAALLLLIAAGICFAVIPGLDPLDLSESGRTGYVYAAELLLALLLGHLRLTAPVQFGHGLGQNWPFVILAIAFAGAGLSEVFDRLRLRVLAEPLRRTGLFLPMLPVLVFWVRPAGNYATLWFAAGLFYALLSVTRRSLALALLAAVAVNVGLWTVLHQNQVAFVRYPQLWLVPFALTVLVASHLNRDRLPRNQLATLRYVSLTVVYVASTAETFMAGLGQDVMRPLVLIALSVAGVFGGMMLRVRAFLFLGASFVGLGVFALVWHAATHKAWVWYIAGILLGIAIIVLFAVFEKRRPQVLHLLEKLKEWD